MVSIRRFGHVLGKYLFSSATFRCVVGLHSFCETQHNNWVVHWVRAADTKKENASDVHCDGTRKPKFTADMRRVSISYELILCLFTLIEFNFDSWAYAVLLCARNGTSNAFAYHYAAVWSFHHVYFRHFKWNKCVCERKKRPTPSPPPPHDPKWHDEFHSTIHHFCLVYRVTGRRTGSYRWWIQKDGQF